LLFEDDCPVFEPVAFSGQFDDFAFVGQTIRQCRSKNLVTRHLCPLFRFCVGGNDE